MLHTEEGKQMETKLERIARIAKERPEEKFTSLIHLINKDSLIQSHNEMNGRKAAGVDNITKDEYGRELEANIDDLLIRMKKQSYKPLPVRRTYIPKGNNEKRPLGVLSYEDKLVQRASAKILNAIYEQDFMECSFGFRPQRNAHDAIALVDKIVDRKKINYVVDTDIKKFFDKMSHDWIMKFLEHRISDKNLLRLIKRMLIAGVMDGSQFLKSEQGAIQGGGISPILANLYLHYVLDVWFEKVIRKRCRGKSYMVRFADDSVFFFQYEEDAYEFFELLKVRLGKFDLEVNEGKSKIICIKDDRDDDGNKPSFDFLGFNHYMKTGEYGYKRMGRRTSCKKFAQSLKKCKVWMKNNRTLDMKTYMNKLKVKLTGYCNYYAITGNQRKVSDFLDKCKGMLFKWLNKRSQKRSFNYEKFTLFLRKYPIPKSYTRVNLSKRTKGLSYLSEW
jgi:group II intron reverse transcriptase/maturase